MAESDLDASEAMSDPPLLDDELLEQEYIMDTQQYKTYKTMVMLKEYMDLGLPLSFVVASVAGVATMGFVIGSGSSANLLPLHIGSVSAPQELGFPYFLVSVNVLEGPGILLYTRSAEGHMDQHISVVNYGHLLPHLASVETGAHVPYAIITTDAYHLNAQYLFI